MGGCADCDGAILLQGEQLVRVAWMSCVMPGQKMDDSAFEIILAVPWWAAWRADRHDPVLVYHNAVEVVSVLVIFSDGLW